MLNHTSVMRDKLASPTQILANVEMQVSVGCIVKQDIGVAVGGKKVAKAGTPIKVALDNLSTPATKADGSVAMNAVLLHDVDVTAGNNNGTALIFGFVNTNRVESDVKTAITTAAAAADASKLITFVAL